MFPKLLRYKDFLMQPYWYAFTDGGTDNTDVLCQREGIAQIISMTALWCIKKDS